MGTEKTGIVGESSTDDVQGYVYVNRNGRTLVRVARAGSIQEWGNDVYYGFAGYTVAYRLNLPNRFGVGRITSVR